LLLQRCKKGSLPALPQLLGQDRFTTTEDITAMADPTQPNQSLQEVQGGGQPQPTKMPDVAISWEQFKKLLGLYLAEEVMTHIKKRIWVPVAALTIFLAVVGWIGYKSLDPLLRQTMQDNIADLKAATISAKEAAEYARSSARKNAEGSKEVQEVIDDLNNKALNVLNSFEVLNVKIESSQRNSTEYSRDIEEIRNNIKNFENVINGIGQKDEETKKILADYTKTNEEQRKNTEEERLKISENSAYSVAVIYNELDQVPIYNQTNKYREVVLTLNRYGFLTTLVEKRMTERAKAASISKQETIFDSSQPKITYFDDKYEDKAREVQRLIKPIINIDIIELATISKRSLSLWLSPRRPSPYWAIEVSF
jgi:hypothetical protein